MFNVSGDLANPIRNFRILSAYLDQNETIQENVSQAIDSPAM